MPNNNFSNMIVIIIKSLNKSLNILLYVPKRSYKFSTILEKLYKQESQCRDQKKEFTIGIRVIDNNLTLKENDIKYGDIIEFKIKNEEEGEEVNPNEISMIFRNDKFKFPLIWNKKDIIKDLKYKF